MGCPAVKCETGKTAVGGGKGDPVRRGEGRFRKAGRGGVSSGEKRRVCVSETRRASQRPGGCCAAGRAGLRGEGRLRTARRLCLAVRGACSGPWAGVLSESESTVTRLTPAWRPSPAGRSARGCQEEPWVPCAACSGDGRWPSEAGGGKAAPRDGSRGLRPRSATRSLRVVERGWPQRVRRVAGSAPRSGPAGPVAGSRRRSLKSRTRRWWPGVGRLRAQGRLVSQRRSRLPHVPQRQARGHAGTLGAAAASDAKQGGAPGERAGAHGLASRRERSEERRQAGTPGEERARCGERAGEAQEPAEESRQRRELPPLHPLPRRVLSCPRAGCPTRRSAFPCVRGAGPAAVSGPWQLPPGARVSREPGRAARGSLVCRWSSSRGAGGRVQTPAHVPSPAEAGGGAERGEPGRQRTRAPLSSAPSRAR